MNFASHIALAFTLFCFSSLRAEQNESTSDQKLGELQGNWELVSVHYDREAIDVSSQLARFRVVDSKIDSIEPPGRFTKLSAIGEGVRIRTEGQRGQALYPRLQEIAKQRGSDQRWDSGGEQQILVHITGFGLVGLYRSKSNGDVELVLKYLGQGVEGEDWNGWRPPGDFERRAGQARLHVVLRRMDD